MVAVVCGSHLMGQNALNRNTTGYATKEEPCRKDEQEQCDCGNKQTFTRGRYCQQTVKLFPFILRFGNCIVK